MHLFLITRRSRDLSRSTEALTIAGREDFSRTYGDTATTVQTLLDDFYPDLGKAEVYFADHPHIYRPHFRVLLDHPCLWFYLFLLRRALACRHFIYDDRRAHCIRYTASN